MVISARKEIAAPLAEEPSIAMLAATIVELREDNISMREDISKGDPNEWAPRMSKNHALFARPFIARSPPPLVRIVP